jgi:hypothetical protein
MLFPAATQSRHGMNHQCECRALSCTQLTHQERTWQCVIVWGALEAPWKPISSAVFCVGTVSGMSWRDQVRCSDVGRLAPTTGPGPIMATAQAAGNQQRSAAHLQGRPRGASCRQGTRQRRRRMERREEGNGPSGRPPCLCKTKSGSPGSCAAAAP